MRKKGMIFMAFLVGAGMLVAHAGFSSGQPAPYRIARGIYVGGPCDYARYEGTATIIRIEKTQSSIEQASVEGGPGYEGYEVLFVFQTDKAIKEAWAQDVLDKEHLILLNNSWYPGPEFIKKYQIAVGKTFKATLCVITKGTCSPIDFEFSEIDLRDYLNKART